LFRLDKFAKRAECAADLTAASEPGRLLHSRFLKVRLTEQLPSLHRWTVVGTVGVAQVRLRSGVVQSDLCCWVSLQLLSVPMGFSIRVPRLSFVSPRLRWALPRFWVRSLPAANRLRELATDQIRGRHPSGSFRWLVSLRLGRS
jgi:hypothetical protein